MLKVANSVINASQITGVLPVVNGGTGVTTSTGTGNTVLSSSPSLVTPTVSTTLGVGAATPAASGSGITFPATQSASTDLNTLDDYREVTATLTATGMTTSPTGTATFVRVGRSVVVEIPYITGTSNSTAFTLTGIPAEYRPVSNRRIIVPIIDNGTACVPCLAFINSSGVITLFRNMDDGAFTASGTKAFNGVNVSYYI